MVSYFTIGFQVAGDTYLCTWNNLECSSALTKSEDFEDQDIASCHYVGVIIISGGRESSPEFRLMHT